MTRRTTNRSALFLFVLALAVGFPPARITAQPAISPAALEPPATGGLPFVDRALARLSTHRRLLVIAAHPDDEDTSLLTLVSRGMGGESAYLSLSRGEGGQNLIGPELGADLGLIRTRELLAARGVDGGRQFFTRAYDFGYTRSLEETLRLWPKDVLLEDAVRIIRRFKPQIVVSIFPGQPHPNHGQHQAAGVTAHEAFPLAGDASALPQLAAEGLQPWTPQVLYRSGWFNPPPDAITLSTSGLDPLAGKSYYQIAMASRSMHRSQDMGRLQELGPQETRVVPESGAAVAAKDLFAGVDTRLSAIAANVTDPGRRKRAADHLDAAQSAAERTRAALVPEKLGDAVPGFVEILEHLRGALAVLDRPEERPAAELIVEKIRIAEAGLAAAAGIAVDATTDRDGLVAGDTFPVQAVLWNSGTHDLAKTDVELVPVPDWGGLPVNGGAQDPKAGSLAKWDLQMPVPAQAPPTTPYFLEKPLTGSLYDWSVAPAADRGEPFGPPPLTARFQFAIDGLPVTIEREVVHLHRDQAVGEIRLPLRVVPKVEVSVTDELLVWPVSRREPRRLQVTVASHAAQPVHGQVEAALTGGAGWTPVAPVPFSLEPGQEQSLDLSLQPAGLAPGHYQVRLAAVLDDGSHFDMAAPVIDYPHIRPTPHPEPAAVAIRAADIKLPPLKRVGYVRGASDRVPQFLLQVGVPLEMLGAHELLEGDLSRYDAIILGSRAYETDPVLARANHRILDYVRAGGLVIVQYQQYPFIEGKFMPFPLEIARPHDRVTDETAAVTVLDPSNPVFTTPNKIGPEDWEGWIQERGLYFAHTWDPAYVPLLAMTDPDQPEMRGSLLVAPLGKGHYVYTGLSFFRQLPAGVPGAYRLFANLLALR